MGRFPWRDFAAALLALITLGVVWAVTRGVLDEAAGATVNAAAAAAVAVVIAWSAWRGWRHAAKPSSGVDLAGELRSALIDRVRSRWIGARDSAGRLSGDGRLAADLTLGVELEILLERWAGEGSDEPASVLDAWRRSGHTVVLTGEPGAGKSVQLLLLAEQLLDEAERQPEAGVPVVLGLGGWRGGDAGRGRQSDGRPFEDWLVTEIHARFRVPREDARRWLAQGDLIPILDGLDEAPPERRMTLFTQLKEWVRDEERPPAAWAVGCRQREYSELDPERTLIGGRSTFWSVKRLGDLERLRFLRRAATSVHEGWRPVISALESGGAQHLTGTDGDDHGVLATPLGLAIAVEAYRADDVDDQSTPAELLNPGEDWDRLWTRYVAHRYHATHRDPDEGTAGTGQRYSSDEVRRWLATLASEEFGTDAEIDLIDVEPPERPPVWQGVWTWIEDPEDLLEGLYFGWLTLLLPFAAFGAVIGGFGWGGVAGVSLVAAVALAYVVLLVVGRSRARHLEGEELTVAMLSGLPALFVIGAGLSWPGEPIARWIQPTVSRLEGLGFRIGEFELRIGDIQLGGWGAGALTGLAVATMYALLLGLVLCCALLYGVVTLYRRRDVADRPASPESVFERYLWWLDFAVDDLEDLYRRWVARHFLLRWWHFGSPVWSWRRTGLIPHPREWDRFVTWATHRGYLRPVGDQRVWVHETLRQWFVRYLDVEALRALQERPDSDRKESDDGRVFDKAKYHYEGDWPPDLDRGQAFVHTGLYLGWLLSRGLVRPDVFTAGEGQAALHRFRDRELTGPELYARWFDGVLSADMLTDEGDRFTRDYFDLRTGRFLEDYQGLLMDERAQIYLVEDSWENFDLLSHRLDERLREWRATSAQ